MNERMTRIPCRHCMPPEQATAEDIARIIEAIPKERRVSDEEYNDRLARCSGCEKLFEGTCSECGCYVAVRCARARMYCPLYKW